MIPRPGLARYELPVGLPLLTHDVLLLILESGREELSIDEIAREFGLSYETIAETMRELHDFGAARCFRADCAKCVSARTKGHEKR